MRTRFAIVSMLVVGVLLTSTAGVGMALGGSSGSGSAGNAQYGPPPTHHHNHLAPPSSNTAPPDGTVQAAQQVSTPTGSSQLPFTGLVLIPLIILGVAMLLIGLVLRSRSTRAPNS
jgi:hypothetical protein